MEREINAARVVDRRFFVNKDFLNLAHEDIPLPIGEEQTISQPSTVIKMLQYLDLRKGQKVLEIGSGSGWNAALISYLIGNKGNVTTIERHDSLAKLAKSNIKGFMKYLISKDKRLLGSFSEIRAIHGNFFSYFKKSKKKYDRIIFTAGIDYSDKEVVNTVEEIAEKILANQGIMILPMALGPLIIYKKIKDKLIKSKTEEEYRFVLLRSG